MFSEHKHWNNAEAIFRNDRTSMIFFCLARFDFDMLCHFRSGGLKPDMDGMSSWIMSLKIHARGSLENGKAVHFHVSLLEDRCTSHISFEL